jgi:citrate lyase subunit beta / citryl-CoA lyase
MPTVAIGFGASTTGRPMTDPLDPRIALFDPGEPVAVSLPVCDHYAGVESRMRRSLELQAELGPVFDVTLDCEDGAPVGAEREHAHLVAELAMSPLNRHARVGARVHPVSHAAFADDVATLIGRAGHRLAYVMVPKLRDAGDAQAAVEEIDRVWRASNLEGAIPVHGLVETHGALAEVGRIAAHPRIESLSFGLMDFVSAHRGAIPASAMTATGQFAHPLVLRAKLEIAAACHAHGKTPSHGVVTEFKDLSALQAAVRRAADELGYTRMWSIHPDQIRPIVQAFTPATHDVERAGEILLAARAASWAPISHRNMLHDRASYRYFWHVLDRAWRTGQALDSALRQAFFPPVRS